MNDGGPIVKLFYNVIPGSLFLTLLKIFCIFDIFSITSEPTLIIFIYFLAGIFLGFIFQGITKFARSNLGWTNRIISEVLEKNKDYKLDIVFGKTNKTQKGNRKNIKMEEKRNAFYLMDNDLSLSTGEPAFFPEQFSSLFTFWSNIFFALLIINLINIFIHPNLNFLSVIVPAEFISWYLADRYFFAYYDSILKSYYMKHIEKF